MPVVVANLVESLARANLPDAVHHFVKSLRITGGSLVDGSYGLQRSPCGRFVLSAHRGKDVVGVYRYPSFEHRRSGHTDARLFGVVP